MATTRDAILFRKALGLNDSTATSTVTMVTAPRDPEAGSVEFTDCLNLNVTPDGCVEKSPALVTALAVGSPVTRLTSDKRLFFFDGTNTNEWTTGSTVVSRFPATQGAIVHTPIDVRLCTGAVNYKSPHAAPTAVAATVGTNPGPPSSISYSAMPLFTQGFVYNSNLYTVNKGDTRVLNYSRDYFYDLFNLGDGHIASQYAVLQSGAIKGVLITTHAEGISVYKGMTPSGAGFEKKFYPCAPIDKTLYSGRVSKLDEHGHVLLCADGVYFIGEDGVPKNLTLSKTEKLYTLNTSYYGACVHDGKYRAVGGTVDLVYDFRTKCLLKQAPQGATGICVWRDTEYYAVGSNIATPGAASRSMGCSLTLPFSDLSAYGKKRVLGLYFSGTATGRWRITATDRAGASWAIDRNDAFSGVTSQYIKTPHAWLGNHISFKVECITGDFRLEELRAAVATSNRS